MKQLVRFPNQETYLEVDIDFTHFTQTNEFDDCVFGWYKGTYISILKPLNNV
jgi:hypothetical protein